VRLEIVSDFREKNTFPKTCFYYRNGEPPKKKTKESRASKLGKSEEGSLDIGLQRLAWILHPIPIEEFFKTW